MNEKLISILEKHKAILDKLLKAVAEYARMGFKVYYNEFPTIPKMEKGGIVDNGIFVCSEGD